ncbi:MAG: hypothetical protein K6E40_12720 [Desulfovibrio sp.]|nr:hypothetical protein [Desulfovibrio sp.]
MKMLRQLHDQILQEASPLPPETGGILGGRNGIVSVRLADPGLPSCRSCNWTPDTVRLNSALAEWREEGIWFMGMYHVHFGNSCTLSKDDEDYIRRIMEAMPASIEILHFPVVSMPDRAMAVWSARNTDGKTEIFRDKAVLV